MGKAPATFSAGAVVLPGKSAECSRGATSKKKTTDGIDTAGQPAGATQAAAAASSDEARSATSVSRAAADGAACRTGEKEAAFRETPSDSAAVAAAETAAAPSGAQETVAEMPCLDTSLQGCVKEDFSSEESISSSTGGAYSEIAEACSDEGEADEPGAAEDVLSAFVAKHGGLHVLRRILVANNGNAAVRCIRSMRHWAYEALGDSKALEFVVLATPDDIDANAEFIAEADFYVEVPAGPNSNNYANLHLIVQTAETYECDAVWPGWGHASENHRLPALLQSLKRKVIWIGPSPQAMLALGDKIGSSIIAQSVNVPCVPWSGMDVTVDLATVDPMKGLSPQILRRACVQSAKDVLDCCRRIGYPVMIKASEGGGGKGIRRVTCAEEVSDAYRQVVNEVKGSPVFVMHMVSNCRHLEVQLLADRHGRCVSLGSRDCTIQRRCQKIIEEGPVVAAPSDVIRRMEEAACRMAAAVGYENAGTCEFLYDPATEEFFFLEVNARLQVEHVVTECVGDFNLPAAQLQVAMGIPLDEISDIRAYIEGTRVNQPPQKHIVAARITAEHAEESFRPTVGLVHELTFRPSRFVWGYFSIGSKGNIHAFNDAQFGHLFAQGKDRREAVKHMVLSLKDMTIRGELRTNVEALIQILEHPDFLANDTHTTWLEQKMSFSSNGDGVSPALLLGVLLAAVFESYTHFRKSEAEFIKRVEQGQLPPSLAVAYESVLVHRGRKFTLPCVYAGPHTVCVQLRDSSTSVHIRRITSAAAAGGSSHGGSGGGGGGAAAGGGGAGGGGGGGVGGGGGGGGGAGGGGGGGGGEGAADSEYADGGFLVKGGFDGKSRKVYFKRDSTGLRVSVSGTTFTFTKEADPTQVRPTVSGKLVRWLVGNGQHVVKGQSYAEIEIMKMYMQLHMEESGKLMHAMSEGAVFQAGDLLATLELPPGVVVKKAIPYEGPFPACGDASSFAAADAAAAAFSSASPLPKEEAAAGRPSLRGDAEQQQQELQQQQQLGGSGMSCPRKSREALLRQLQQRQARERRQRLLNPLPAYRACREQLVNVLDGYQLREEDEDALVSKFFEYLLNPMLPACEVKEVLAALDSQLPETLTERLQTLLAQTEARVVAAVGLEEEVQQQQQQQRRLRRRAAAAASSTLRKAPAAATAAAGQGRRRASRGSAALGGPPAGAEAAAGAGAAATGAGAAAEESEALGSTATQSSTKKKKQQRHTADEEQRKTCAGEAAAITGGRRQQQSTAGAAAATAVAVPAAVAASSSSSRPAASLLLRHISASLRGSGSAAAAAASAFLHPPSLLLYHSPFALELPVRECIAAVEAQLARQQASTCSSSNVQPSQAAAAEEYVGICVTRAQLQPLLTCLFKYERGLIIAAAAEVAALLERYLEVEELFEESRETVAKVLSLKRTQVDPQTLALLQRSHQSLPHKNRLLAKVLHFIQTSPVWRSPQFFQRYMRSYGHFAQSLPRLHDCLQRLSSLGGGSQEYAAVSLPARQLLLMRRQKPLPELVRQLLRRLAQYVPAAAPVQCSFFAAGLPALRVPPAAAAASCCCCVLLRAAAISDGAPPSPPPPDSLHACCCSCRTRASSSSRSSCSSSAGTRCCHPTRPAGVCLSGVTPHSSTFAAAAVTTGCCAVFSSSAGPCCCSNAADAGSTTTHATSVCLCPKTPAAAAASLAQPSSGLGSRTGAATDSGSPAAESSASRRSKCCCCWKQLAHCGPAPAAAAAGGKRGGEGEGGAGLCCAEASGDRVSRCNSCCICCRRWHQQLEEQQQKQQEPAQTEESAAAAAAERGGAAAGVVSSLHSAAAAALPCGSFCTALQQVRRMQQPVGSSEVWGGQRSSCCRAAAGPVSPAAAAGSRGGRGGGAFFFSSPSPASPSQAPTSPAAAAAGGSSLAHGSPSGSSRSYAGAGLLPLLLQEQQQQQLVGGLLDELLHDYLGCPDPALMCLFLHPNNNVKRLAMQVYVSRHYGRHGLHGVRIHAVGDVWASQPPVDEEAQPTPAAADTAAAAAASAAAASGRSASVCLLPPGMTTAAAAGGRGGGGCLSSSSDSYASLYFSGGAAVPGALAAAAADIWKPPCSSSSESYCHCRGSRCHTKRPTHEEEEEEAAAAGMRGGGIPRSAGDHSSLAKSHGLLEEPHLLQPTAAATEQQQQLNGGGGMTHHHLQRCIPLLGVWTHHAVLTHEFIVGTLDQINLHPSPSCCWSQLFCCSSQPPSFSSSAHHHLPPAATAASSSFSSLSSSVGSSSSATGPGATARVNAALPNSRSSSSGKGTATAAEDASAAAASASRPLDGVPQPLQDPWSTSPEQQQQQKQHKTGSSRHQQQLQPQQQQEEEEEGALPRLEKTPQKKSLRPPRQLREQQQTPRARDIAAAQAKKEAAAAGAALQQQQQQRRRPPLSPGASSTGSGGSWSEGYSSSGSSCLRPQQEEEPHTQQQQHSSLIGSSSSISSSISSSSLTQHVSPSSSCCNSVDRTIPSASTSSPDPLEEPHLLAAADEEEFTAAAAKASAAAAAALLVGAEEPCSPAAAAAGGASKGGRQQLLGGGETAAAAEGNEGEEETCEKKTPGSPLPMSCRHLLRFRQQAESSLPAAAASLLGCDAAAAATAGAGREGASAAEKPDTGHLLFARAPSAAATPTQASAADDAAAGGCNSQQIMATIRVPAAGQAAAGWGEKMEATLAIKRKKQQEQEEEALQLLQPPQQHMRQQQQLEQEEEEEEEEEQQQQVEVRRSGGRQTEDWDVQRRVQHNHLHHRRNTCGGPAAAAAAAAAATAAAVAPPSAVKSLAAAAQSGEGSQGRGWEALRGGSKLLHLLTCFTAENGEQDEEGILARSQQSVAMAFDGLHAFEATFLDSLLELQHLSTVMPPPPPTVDGKLLQLFIIDLRPAADEGAASSGSDAACAATVGRLLNEAAGILSACRISLVVVVLLSGRLPGSCAAAVGLLAPATQDISAVAAAETAEAAAPRSEQQQQQHNSCSSVSKQCCCCCCCRDTRASPSAADAASEPDAHCRCMRRSSGSTCCCGKSYCCCPPAPAAPCSPAACLSLACSSCAAAAPPSSLALLLRQSSAYLQDTDAAGLDAPRFFYFRSLSKPPSPRGTAAAVPDAAAAAGVLPPSPPPSPCLPGPPATAAAAAAVSSSCAAACDISGGHARDPSSRASANSSSRRYSAAAYYSAAAAATAAPATSAPAPATAAPATASATTAAAATAAGATVPPAAGSATRVHAATLQPQHGPGGSCNSNSSSNGGGLGCGVVVGGGGAATAAGRGLSSPDVVASASSRGSRPPAAAASSSTSSSFVSSSLEQRGFPPSRSSSLTEMSSLCCSTPACIGFVEEQLIRHAPVGQLGLLELQRFLPHFKIQFIPTSLPHIHVYKARPRQQQQQQHAAAAAALGAGPATRAPAATTTTTTAAARGATAAAARGRRGKGEEGGGGTAAAAAGAEERGSSNQRSGGAARPQAGATAAAGSRFFVRALLSIVVGQQQLQRHADDSDSFFFSEDEEEEEEAAAGGQGGEGRRRVWAAAAAAAWSSSSSSSSSPSASSSSSPSSPRSSSKRGRGRAAAGMGCSRTRSMQTVLERIVSEQERQFVSALNVLEAVCRAGDGDAMAGNHLLLNMSIQFVSAACGGPAAAAGVALRESAAAAGESPPPSSPAAGVGAAAVAAATSAGPSSSSNSSRGHSCSAARGDDRSSKGDGAAAAADALGSTSTATTASSSSAAASSSYRGGGIASRSAAAAPPLHFISVALLEAAARNLLSQYERRLAKMNVKTTELRYVQRSLRGPPSEGRCMLPLRFVADNPTGQALRLRKFAEVTNPTTGQLIFSSIDSRGILCSSSSSSAFASAPHSTSCSSSSGSVGFFPFRSSSSCDRADAAATERRGGSAGSAVFSAAAAASQSAKLSDAADLDGRPVLLPHPLPNALDVRRARAFNVSTVFIYDFPDLFEEAIRKQWKRCPKYILPASSAEPHATGRTMFDGRQERCATANTFLPERVFEATELRLNSRGELEEVHREAGLNECGMVAWRVTMYTPEFPKGRRIILIGNDVTFQMGTFGVTEDLLFQRASEIARKEGIPRIYISVNSGARMGLATEVMEKFRVEWIDASNPTRGFKYLYVTEADYQQLRKTNSIVAEPVLHPREGKVYKITTVVGAQIGLGVENLCGSGAIAGETAKAYRETFTITFCSGRSVGIGAYLTRLGQRVIQKAVNAPLLLTGYQALNRLIGRDVYSSNEEIGGIDVMYKNGISHLTVKDDIEGCEAILDWLAYIPARREGPLPIVVDPTEPVSRRVAYTPARATEDPRLMFTGCADPSGNWLGGFFDRGSYREVMADWAKSVIVGRARLGGIPVGVVAVETRVTEAKQPADPAMPHTSEVLLTRAGQVWFPDSAYKTAQAIWDFNQEELPLFIFANWRGFSGGQRDMFNEILKFGAYIVDALVAYTQPCFVYLPPKGELRGGSWVVVDSRLNAEHMEMYADIDSRGGVMEPSGTVEIKFRDKMLVDSMKRLDSCIRQLENEDMRLASEGLPIDSPQRQELKEKRSRRIQKLLPVYKQVAIHFADMHDTAVRMKKLNAVNDVIPWEKSRHFFYWRLRRQLILFSLRREVAAAEPSLSLIEAERLVLQWAQEARHDVEGNCQFVQWACHSIAFFSAKLAALRANRARKEIEMFAEEHPSAFLDVLRKLNPLLYERLEVLSHLSEQQADISSSEQRSLAALSLITKPNDAATSDSASSNAPAANLLSEARVVTALSPSMRAYE